MDSLSQQNVTAVKDAIDSRIEGAFDARFERWILGRLYTDGVRLTDSLISGGNRVYVRPTTNSYEYRVVWGNASGANLPVWIFQMPDKEWYLFSPYYAAAGAIGAKADTVFMPPIAGDVARFVLSGENFRPGRVRIDAAGGLNAYVEPFHYWYEGVEKYWAGGSVDLTSAVPGTTDQWRWVKVGINPATNAITTTNGTAQSLYVPLTEALLAAITMPTMIPLAGVKLRNGQTRIGITETDIIDARHHYWTPQPILRKSNLTATTNPTTGDDTADGYAIGSVWINTSTDVVYICTDATAGAAVWVTSGTASGFTVEEADGSPSVTNVNKIKFTSGSVTDDGGGVVSVSLTAGIVSYGTKFEIHAPPSSPDALDDEFADSSVNVAWTEIDHASALTPSEDAAGLLLTATSSSGNCGLVKSIPSGDFTIETLVHINQVSNTVNDASYAGLSLWQGTTSTDDLVGLILNPQQTRVEVGTWTAYNAFSALAGLNFTTVATHMWLRIQRSSSTFTYWYSTSGLTWRRLHSGTLAYSPTHFGVHTGTGSAATAYARFSYFRYTSSVLTPGQSIGGRRVNLISP